MCGGVRAYSCCLDLTTCSNMVKTAGDNGIRRYFNWLEIESKSTDGLLPPGKPVRRSCEEAKESFFFFVERKSDRIIYKVIST